MADPISSPRKPDSTSSPRKPDPVPAPRKADSGETLAQSIAGEARDIGGGLKDIATDLASDARQQADARLTKEKDRFAGAIGNMAHAIRDAKSNGEGEMDLGPYAKKAAEQMERVSDYLSNRGLMEMAEDVEDFARREPALFLGGAFVLGLVGGRFLKASRAARHAQHEHDEDTAR
jgi:hypothetical protein